MEVSIARKITELSMVHFPARHGADFRWLCLHHLNVFFGAILKGGTVLYRETPKISRLKNCLLSGLRRTLHIFFGAILKNRRVLKEQVDSV